ncbi:hypothetical protein E3J95_03980 [Candidatus Aerophobetes bacterium]|uniref:TonB-dependent receptor-like beta-barrel domain-containing protein n=1 Tax=Aerophobetes bacterium TaxID=2030807 RepID=A0A523QJ18_UNCAE|nr:MAG: hypothetical protein E3J95_03980 [Candidatus Aerophobetes bacterium]
MRKTIVSVMILLGLCKALWGQEGQLPTELPIVVVKGTDRSYLHIVRPKILAHMGHRGEKELSLPPREVWGEKSYHRPPSIPGLEVKPSPVIPWIKSKGPSPPRLLHVSLSTPIIQYAYAPPSYPIKAISDMIPASGTKLPLAITVPTGAAILSPSIMAPGKGGKLSLLKESELLERSFPPSKEESSLPYLHFSASAGSYNNYGYRMDYGRKPEKNAWVFTLGRDYSPRRVEYYEEELGRDEDIAAIEFTRDSGEDGRILLDLGGHQVKLDMPDGTQRVKNKIDIGGERKIEGKRNKFRIQGWAERTQIKTQDEVEYEDVAMGTRISLQMLRSPLVGGLQGETSTSSGSTQAYLFLAGHNVTLKDIKGLALNIEAGLKDIGGWGTEFLPQVELAYDITPRLKIRLNGQREFRLARFSDLYFSRDYVIIDEDLPPLRSWGFGGGFTYSPSETWDVSLGGFLDRGDNLVWNWDGASSLMRPLIRDILLKGGRLSWVLHLNDVFEQELGYTYQQVDNQDDPEKIVPGYPGSSGELWLRWKPGNWLIEAGGEIEGERYYEENLEELLPFGYKGKVKVGRKIGKGGELWIELQLNDYSPLENFSLPDQKVSVGIHIPLF